MGVCVCACVCLGLGQCFHGSTECAGDGFLGIIDLALLQTEGNWRDYHIPFIRVRGVFC